MVFGDVLVVPVIGLLSNTKAFNPVPDTAEVEAIFAPLEMFLKVFTFFKALH